jgi:hypothetical protein
MDQDVLLLVMTAFVIVSAIALCIQAAMLFGIYKATKSLQAQAMSVMPQVKSILTKADATVEESRKRLADITEKASQMMDIGKTQLVRLDELMSDASARAKIQIERAELVVDDTMTRVHESVTTLHNGILRPVKEIQGIATGVRTAVEHFLRGGRPSVAQATQDDEMFI